MCEMVERIARAIWSLYEDTDCSEYDELTEHRKEYAREMARAAIIAMRKPTTKMIHAAAGAMSPGKRPTLKRVSCSQKHMIRYQAMIDEALL